MTSDLRDHETGFARLDAGYAVLDNPVPPPEFLDSYNDLIFDKHAPGCNRYRRFSQFQAEFNVKSGLWEIGKLPHRPFIQSYAQNHLVGGQPRYFEPIKTDFNWQIDHLLRTLGADQNRKFQIDVNQYRVIATQDADGISVPEGKHRDGRPVVCVPVYRRENVQGAELILYPNESDAEVMRRVIGENECAALIDKMVRHDATSISPVNKSKLGIRDYAAINFVPWEQRCYGRVFEASVLAPGVAVDESRCEPFGAYNYD